MTGTLFIDADRLSHELATLAQFSDAPAPAVTRVMLSPTDLAARDYLIEQFRAADLQVRRDPAGNLFARWEGQDPNLPAVATGSHTDAIPHSGRYDGTVGVLGALEAIRALRTAGFQPTRSIELLMFTSEEPTRFGVGCLGSRLLSGGMPAVEAAGLCDEQGISFDQLRQSAGLSGMLDDVRLPPDHYHGFLELHIEQGPLLEQTGVPIGIVTQIAAPAALRVQFTGSGGHAGAVLMAGRRDALLPAAELALAVDAIARQIGSQDTVATTGVLHVHPGAINSIPSTTVLEIDVRDVELTRRDAVVEAIRTRAQTIGAQRRQSARVELIYADPPANCDPGIVDAIATACQRMQLEQRTMISRAYHDALFMARICPTGMIFIPCRDGVSHRPDEYASPAAIALGCQVLAQTLQQLAS